MTDQSQQPPFGMPPFDPAAMQAMWQNMMGQAAKTNATSPGMPSPEMSGEMFKQMQKAYLDAMARYADEYMRSPQFIEAMKKSLETTLAMRRQVEDFVRKSTEQSYGSTMGVYDAVGAVRDAESWISRRIDELANRMAAIEEALGVKKPTKRSSKPAPSKKKKKSKATSGATRKTPARKSTSKKSKKRPRKS